jgi:hypothetical protein
MIPVWQDRENYYIAIDFDGTLVEDKFPKIGELKQSTVKRMELKKELLKKQGKRMVLILWTCRHGNYLDDAVRFCVNQGIQDIFYVNDNPLCYTGSSKIFADEYWDDRAVKID